MPYAYANITLSSALTQLSLRLSDPTNIQWSTTELTYAIQESLRWLQATTGFYRERISLNVQVGQNFYDLRTDLNTPSGEAYPYSFTVTDNQLLAQIQLHLKEPATNPWTGTAQFSIPVIAQAIQRARDQYLTDTGIYTTRQTPFSGMPTNGRIPLPQSTIDIRRAAWRDLITGITYGLSRDDEYAMFKFNQSWPQNPSQPPSYPYGYSVAVTPPLSLQMFPAPTNSGTLDVCLVSTGPTLPCDPANPVVLGIPDDLTWAVKYQALADLFGDDGPASDPDRAAYCRQLYSLAMSLGQLPVTTLQFQIQDILVPLDSIDDYDRFQTNWQFQSNSLPQGVMQIAPNLIALSPAPDQAYIITLDMARSMPVPSLSTDYLQISSDLLEPVLDLAQHIATLKSAGTELQATVPLRDNFLRLAGQLNSKLLANTFYNDLLTQGANRQSLQVPRFTQAQTGPPPDQVQEIRLVR